MEENLLKMFYTTILEGYKNLEFIPDGKDKVKACADISKSIAILLSGTKVKLPASLNNEKDSLTNAASKKNNTKDNSTKKADNAANDTTPEVTNTNTNANNSSEQNNANTASEENTQNAEHNPWDEKKEQISVLCQYIEKWGIEIICNSCIPAFFENTVKSGEVNQDNIWNFIRPENIDAFLIFLQKFAEQYQA